MQIAIRPGLDQIPRGMMVVPLAIRAAFATLAPQTASFFVPHAGQRRAAPCGRHRHRQPGSRDADLPGRRCAAADPVLRLRARHRARSTWVWSAGLRGVALGLAVIPVSGVALIVTDRLSGGTGTAGIAAASTAGNAAAVPALIAAANPAYKAAAAPATILVASCVIVTSLLVPVLTARWARFVERKLPTGDSP